MSLLKPIFRTSKDEIWEKLSHEISAQFVPGETSRGGKIVATVGEWTVTLDIHRVDTQHDHVVYTRLRAPYVNKDGFHFLIHRQTLFSAIEKAFGMQDIAIGHPDFDNHYIVQSNNEPKIKNLLSNAKIREIIKSHPAIYMEVHEDGGWFQESFPEGVDELYCLVEGEITDHDELKSLFELFAETLNHLCHLGDAYENDPNLP